MLEAAQTMNEKNHARIAMLFTASLFLFLTGCGSTPSSALQTTTDAVAPAAEKAEEAATVVTNEKSENDMANKGEDVAVIETNKGTIVIKFYASDAPKAVENFKKLAGEKFYDNLTWHRVVPGFVIQGGDPKGDGTGGPGYTIPDEFNARPHLEGTVAMARPNAPDSAGSQFYICLEAQPSLDGKYTVFGQTIKGFDVVRKIQKGDQIISIRLEKQEVKV